jgi:23S rRNA G2445 N2-methylase RlmL
VVEWEVTEGLETLARAEITGRLGVPAAALSQGTGWIRLEQPLRSDPRALRLAESAFRVEAFAVPRPKALLGDASFRRLTTAIGEVTAGFSTRPKTFALAAAGSDSSVMLRLREAIAATTGLTDGGDEGDVQIRLRRARDGDGWEALLRLTARPLSARPWRVCSFPGALNATVAAAMAQLSNPRPTDRVINLMSGSGTLLIERLNLMPVAEAVGVELDPERIRCAERNEGAAALRSSIRWLEGDARAVPLPDRAADALLADLPFGQRVGRHADNLDLYPAVLREAARLAGARSRFVLLTHEVTLMDRLLRDQASWRPIQVVRLNLRGLHPRLYVLERC